MKNTQASLFDFAGDDRSRKRYGRTRGRTVHGGVFGKDGRHTGRKHERPISTKQSLHVVLKSDKARGRLSFLLPKNSIPVKRIVDRQARKFGVTLQDFANGGNHLHLKLKTKSRLGFQRFLKSVTAMIARHVTGARKGKPFGRFWQGLAFSRVLTSRKEELGLQGYFEANRLEVRGSNRRQGLKRRTDFLEEFNEWVVGITTRHKVLI